MMHFKILLKLTITFLLISCNFDPNYFPHNEGKKIFYDVFFEDKEKKKIITDKVFIFFLK